MAEYVAPLEEMRFMMYDLAGLDHILQLPEFKNREIDADMVNSILEEAGRLANEVLSPLNAIGDKEGNKFKDGEVLTAPGFKEAYKQFAEAGWTGVMSTPEYGGQGLPYLVSTPLTEIWESAALAFSLCPMLTQGAIDALTDHCNDKWLKDTFLARMISGEWAGTMDLTEPQAGSDLGAVRAKAVPEPDGKSYRIYGQKIFITWGEQDFTDNIIHLVLARLPDAPEGTRGISMFIVPKYMVNDDGTLGKRNDVYCVSIEHKLGIKASPTAQLAYGDKEGAVGYLVGEANRGLEYMFTMMNAARLGVGLQGVAVAERAYQAALAYSKERIQSSELGVKNGPRVPIIKHSDVRRMLLHMKSLIESTRAMAYYASAMEDRSHFETDPAVRKECQAQLDLFIPIVKAWCSELGVELSSTAIQIYGGMGYIEESGMPQYLRDAQIAPIYEGTNGIQSLDLIGRKVAMERGATVQKLGLQMQQTVSELAEHENNDDCVAMQKALERGMKAVADSTMWVLLAFGGGNMALASANSMPYLRLMGIMGGGWLMAKSMLIALDKLDKIKKGEIQGNVAFYEAKLVTGRYYADYIMSRASGLAHAITHGGYSVLALKDEQF